MAQPDQNQDNQSQHWIDQEVEKISAWKKEHGVDQLHVDDMKTPSGRVHTGALRGVLLHDLIQVALVNAGFDSINTYVFNDMDPMDGLPTYLDKDKYEPYMGKPLYKIPAPKIEESGIDFSNADADTLQKYQDAKSFAEFYALDFMDAFEKLNAHPEIVWSHELYESGQMDEAIKMALDNIDEIKAIYRDVADYDLPADWYPFQVICESCGKVGTTTTTDWDGEQVSYVCETNKVDWAEGCGHQGQVSPFGGTGKLLWKVDWPAHWKTMGVNVEGAGKDHSSAGGSRDMAKALCERVFGINNPFDMPYEWILIRGAKMSSSKGVGTSAREFVQLFPTEIGRFLFVSNHYNSVIDFDPETMSIPDLFDAYDQGARIFWKEEEGDLRMGRAYEISQVGQPQQYFLPRFRDVAIWMQHPELNLAEEFAKIKGSELTKPELDELESRKHYAQVWIDRYSPEEFRLTPQADLPTESEQMSTEQKEFACAIIKLALNELKQDPEEFQQAIYNQAKESLGARDGFQAIYLAMLGKKSGPRAAWLLLNTDPDILKTRLEQLC